MQTRTAGSGSDVKSFHRTQETQRTIGRMETHCSTRYHNNRMQTTQDNDMKHYWYLVTQTLSSCSYADLRALKVAEHYLLESGVEGVASLVELYGAFTELDSILHKLENQTWQLNSSR